MNALTIDDNTPIAMLTLGQLKNALAGLMPASMPTPVAVTQFNSDEYLQSIDDIAEFFGVSHVTAQRYKDTILKPAVTQYGRKIYVHKATAVELYRKYQSENQ